MALGDCVVLGVICACALWKRVNMAEQASRWRDMELLAEEYVAAVLRLPLAGWNENATFFGTSMTHVDEALHEYMQALETAVFESTKQLLQEHIRRMDAHRWRIMDRLGAIAHMEPTLLEMLDERGHAEWAERLWQNGVLRFGNLAGLEAGELMNRLPGLTLGAASELILESRVRLYYPLSSSRDGRAARRVPEERASNSSNSNYGECVVCLSERATHAVVPCGHMIMCGACAGQARLEQCPLCRGAVAQLMRVFVA